jgi:predicted RNase H-like HicB family nuclease
MQREFNVVVERDEDGLFVASVPALPGCHTQGATLDEVMARIREAILLHLETEADTAVPDMEFVGVQRISVPA